MVEDEIREALRAHMVKEVIRVERLCRTAWLLTDVDQRRRLVRVTSTGLDNVPETVACLLDSTRD